MLDSVTRSYVLSGVALIGALLLGGTAIRAVFFPIDLDHSHAFGCFESHSAGMIEASSKGLRLDGEDGRFLVPFDLGWARGYHLEVKTPVGLVPSGSGFRWKKHARRSSYLMPFDGEPGIFTRHQTDPTRLNRFSVFVTDGDGKASFARTDPSRCAEN